MAIIDAILAGERDPVRLARHRDRRCKNSEETIAKSLQGILRIQLGLAVRHLPVFARRWPNEPEIDRIEIVNLARRHASSQHLIPVLGAWITFVVNGQRFGVPMRDCEVCLL